jgi:acyl carrier protein
MSANPNIEVFSKVADIIRAIVPGVNVTLEPDTPIEAIAGWDSARHVDILMDVEDKFAIKFRTSEMGRPNTIGDLARKIEAKLAARKSG